MSLNLPFKVRNILVTAVFLFIFSCFPAIHTHAQNDSANAACESLGVIDGSSDCTQNTDDVNINSGLENVLSLLSYVAGIIAVIMIMIAGFRFITSQGDSQNVAKARKAIIYASIGILVVVLAQAIIRFVIGAFI